MKSEAIALANYFVDLAKRDNKPLRLWGLMKRVYITYGFYLALYDKSLLDPTVDRVEAWDKGPVITTVQEQFKYYKGDITGKASIGDETPELTDNSVKAVADMVWKRYTGYTDQQLVDLLHREGTPLSLCYRKGANATIPDLYTKTYYLKIVENLRARKANEQ